MSSDGDAPLLRVENLVKYYASEEGFVDRLLGNRGWVKALENVSFAVEPGETLGIVGESGCGKSTLGRTIVQLEVPTDGAVYHEGDDLTTLSDEELRERRKRIQYIFQNPLSSLNPRFTVGDIISEPLRIHGLATSGERQDRVRELLDLVGLSPSHASRYPHEFSGGQQQRIGIARALAVEPELIICDEPVSGLDVSVQAKILNLLKRLQQQLGVSYIFIAHDLSVVEHISDRVGVMYLGELVELGTKDEVFSEPFHPYTEALLSAIPEPDPLWDGDRILLRGSVPSPTDPPSGCRFHTRCPKIIQPEAYDLEHSVWRSIAHFRFQLDSMDGTGDSLVAAPEGERESHGTGERAAAIRESFDIPAELGDEDAERVLSRALDYVATGDVDEGKELLDAEFVSPCETDHPTTDSNDHHRIACHLFDDH